MIEPEIAVYPDSNMVGLFASTPPDGRSEESAMKNFLRADADVEYLEGED